MQRIKQFLSRFLPSPARTFHKKHFELINLIQESKVELGGIQTFVQESKAELCFVQTLAQEIKVELNSIQALVQESDAEQNNTQKTLQEIKVELNSIQALVQESDAEQNNTQKILQERKVELNNIQAVAQESKAELKNIQAMVQESKAELNKINTVVSKMSGYITRNMEERVLYVTRADAFEARVLGAFSSFRQRDDYGKAYLNLISGLDKESRKTVAQINKRLEMISEKEGSFDLFTQVEQQQIRHQRYYRSKNLFKVSEDCYCLGEYMLPINSFLESVFFDNLGIEMLDDRSKKEIGNKCIIDAGAFIGDSALVLSQYTDAYVHCFEPMSKSFRLIEKTIRLNGVKNIIAVNAALSDYSGKVEFSLIDSGTGSKAVESGDLFDHEEVEVMTLDEYVLKNNLEVGLIKVDVEGAEQAFLRGARETIFAQKPVLIISIYHNPEDFYYIKPEIDSWNLGYSYKIHKPICHSVVVEAVLIAEVL